MIICVEYNSFFKTEWDQFVGKSKNSLFMFFRDYMEYHADRFQDNSLMFYNEKNELIALLPANRKEQIIISHGGLSFGSFVTDFKMRQSTMLDCFESLLTYCKTKEIDKIIYKQIPHIYHRIPAEEDTYALFKYNANLLKIEPSTTINCLHDIKFSEIRKRQIKKAQKNGILFEESNNFSEFLNVLNLVLETRHNTHAVHSLDEITLLKNHFPNNIRLFVGKLDDKVLAGVVLFEYENIVHLQYIAANELAREIGVLDFIISSLIDLYKDTKQYFDFGISSENGGKILNEGLIAQKEGFGARTCCYYTWELSITN